MIGVPALLLLALASRPPAADTSTLQARVDAAAVGATVEVTGGRYRGDLVIDRAIRLVGRGRPLLVGSGNSSVVMVRAPGVTVEGFDIDGGGRGDLARDTSGVHVAAPRATARSVTATNIPPLAGSSVSQSGSTR